MNKFVQGTNSLNRPEKNGLETTQDLLLCFLVVCHREGMYSDKIQHITEDRGRDRARTASRGTGGWEGKV